MPNQPHLSHKAEKRLRNDVQRDAARTRKAETYDVREHTEERAEATEAQVDTERHHDAF